MGWFAQRTCSALLLSRFIFRRIAAFAAGWSAWWCSEQHLLLLRLLLLQV
jgi:hypothetical protein